MDSVNYLRGLLRSWWLILLVAAAGGAGGWVVYHRDTPLYRSSVQLIVASEAPKADEVSARQLTGQRAISLAQIAGTQPAVLDAVKKAGRTGRTNGLAVAAAATDSFVTIVVSGPDAGVDRDVAAAFPATLPGSLVRLSGTSGTPFALNVVAPAVEADAPYSPDLRKDVGLGLAAGLVLGLALSVLRETLNRTVRDSDELQRLTGLTILGTVPKDLPKEQLPAANHPRSARAEAYRQVRTTLLNASARRPLVIAVTSATLGEGKTSVATNVAVVFSRAGHRVALVDADLRRPMVAKFFDLDLRVGLTEVLSGEAGLEDAITYQDDGRLAVITSGRIPANPSEALGSETMTQVLADLARSFEFVVVDTPPILPVTDALVIAPGVDGVVVVARLGHTTRDRIERALAGLERVNATILGVVPNQAGRGADADYHYPYRYSTSKQDQQGETVVPPGRMHADEPAGGGTHSTGRHSGESAVKSSSNGHRPSAVAADEMSDLRPDDAAGLIARRED